MMPGKKCVMFHFFSFFTMDGGAAKLKSLFRPLLGSAGLSAGHNNDATTTKKDVKTGETTTTGHPQVGQGEKNRKSYKIK